MNSEKRPDFIKRAFPAMSAHFAHTLDDMAEKYLKIQFIEIKDLTGILSPEDLMLMKASKANVLMYDGMRYEFSKVEGNLYYYICTTSDDGKIAMDEIILNGDTGEYKHQKLGNEIEEAPEDGKSYARKDGEWVPLSNSALEYTFLSGPINKESITLDDIDAFDKVSSPKKGTIQRKYKLTSDSYIWFVSLKEIDYIAHAGGLEIDFERMPNLTASYNGDKQTWYCYRTTYPLVADTWNLIIKFMGE